MGKQILIIDDDSEVAKMMTDMLESENYRVSYAPDGVRGVDHANRHRVDLILMDISMPIMSGIWFCDAFKKKPQTRNIPIIMVSGLGDEDIKQKAYSVGAVAYLKKPFKAAELLELVKKNL